MSVLSSDEWPISRVSELTVPEASVPAVEICTEISAAGMSTSAIDTLLVSSRAKDRHRGKGNAPVVRDESDVEEVADIGVVLDRLGHIDNQANDQLGDIIPRGRLARKDEGPRLHLFTLRRGRLFDFEILVNDRKDIERLALVLVHPLNLARKDRIDIDRDAQFSFEDVGEPALVILLDDVERATEVLVFRHGHEVLEERGIGNPVLASEGVGSKSGKLGIALQEPTTGSDTVGDVGEKVAALELDKVAEDGGLEQLRVEFGHAVDFEGTDNGEVSHADVFGDAFLDDGHALDPVHVVGPALGHFSEKVAYCQRGSKRGKGLILWSI